MNRRALPARRIDAIEPGLFEVKLVPHGPPVAARIDCQDGLWSATINGEPTRGAAADPFVAPDVTFVWERGVPIPEAEYEFLIARARWAEANNRAHPAANPRKPIDLAAMPPVYRRTA